MKKYFLSLLGFLVLWASFIYFFGTPWPWQVIAAKQAAEHYLQQTYNEAFHVKMPKFWIMDGTFHAEASPVNEPNLIFNVGTEQGEEGIQDNYVANALRYKATQTVTNIFSPFYPEQAIFVEINHLTNRSIRYSVIIDVRHETLTSVEAESEALYPYLEQLQATTLDISQFEIWYANTQLVLTIHDLKQDLSAQKLTSFWAMK